MKDSKYAQIQRTLTELYTDDERPWMVGFSGGKDSTMVLALVIRAVLDAPSDARGKPISIVSTDTRVETPAVVAMLKDTLCRVQSFADKAGLPIDANLLTPRVEESFWVNVIGRGYPPPNRRFRWCTQRLKIDPFVDLVRDRLGHWGEAILHLGARRAESATRAQAMAGRASRRGLRRHPDLPRVWVSNPIEFLSTEEVWAYLLQNANPWGGDNQALYRLYADAGGGECPIQIDTSTPSCGNTRFGCWTCTVVERDKSGEGLLASGDERMERLLEFREMLLHYRDPVNGKRDDRRKNGAPGPGPLLLEARKELLVELLETQEEVGEELISDHELRLIQLAWRADRGADDGQGVLRILGGSSGIMPSTMMEKAERISQIEDDVATDRGVNVTTLRRLAAKVAEYNNHRRARGLKDELLNILVDDHSDEIQAEPQQAQ